MKQQLHSFSTGSSFYCALKWSFCAGETFLFETEFYSLNYFIDFSNYISGIALDASSKDLTEPHKSLYKKQPITFICGISVIKNHNASV